MMYFELKKKKKSISNELFYVQYNLYKVHTEFVCGYCKNLKNNSGVIS